MIRSIFYPAAAPGLPLLTLITWFWTPGIALLLTGLALTGLGIYDIT